MGIESEISGRSPVLYWPLDDPTGPAAVDAASGAHPGVYGGAFMTHQYGPEAGTFAAQFSLSGFVRCTGFPQIGSASWSVVWYTTIDLTGTFGNTRFIGHAGSPLTRGWQMGWSTTSGFTLTYWNAAGSPASTSAIGLPTMHLWWHAYAITFNGTQFRVFYDGLQAGAILTVSGTMSTVLSTDVFGIDVQKGAVFAHLAYFDHVLSDSDIAVIHGFRYAWPFGPMVNAVWPNPPAGSGSALLSPTDPVVVGITTDTTDIRRAVLHDYPPGYPYP